MNTSAVPSSTRFRQNIINEANNVALLYIAGKQLDQPATRESKEIIEGIVAADYEGRTLVELLQNGHDAHDPECRDGMLEFWLREDEGDHGVLYVTNAGNPLDDENFTSLCRVGLSPKRPDQGIGNKGVGFKSVLQLADAPEIYSIKDKYSDRFDGYCFRFARPDDFTTLAARISPDDSELADELRENVASLKVPVPLDTIPEEVASFAARGFVTVVRLILRSAAALEKADRQFAELVSSPVPFHLFLERVAKITLRRTGVEDHFLTRFPSRRMSPPAVPIDEVTLQDGSSYVVLRRIVPEAVMKEAISRSRHEGGIGSGWDRWRGNGTVSIALPVSQVLPAGRLYAFLPMGENAIAPLAAFVNAPFFVQLDRRNLEVAVPLNDMLLSEVATLSAEASVLAARDQLDLPCELLLDLVCWTEAHLHRLTTAVANLEEDLARLPILPPALAAGGRVQVAEGRLWRSQGTVFHADALARAGISTLINAHLGQDRNQRLLMLARGLGSQVLPKDAELAEFAEVFAAALANTTPNEQTWETWAQFYDDLSEEISRGEHLHGLRILVDSQHTLLAATGEKDTGPTVFVASAGGDGDAPTSLPPDPVRRRVAFTAPAIPWRDADGHLRPGRVWLERNDLVQEYRSEPVLMLVGAIMRDPATSGEDQAACLRFAFQLWRTARRRVGEETLRQARLTLPTVSGWQPAGQTYFGTGWDGETADTDRTLGRLLERVAGLSKQLSSIANAILLSADNVLPADGDDDQRRQFVEYLGAHHGLVPWYYTKTDTFSMTGYQVANPLTAPRLPIDVSGQTQQAWRTLAARWPRVGPSHVSVRYAPAARVATLPGQEDFDTFDSDIRKLYAELILRGLDTWPETSLEYTYARSTDYSRPAWPTLLAAFLSYAPWIPQTTPSDRGRIEYESCKTAWWLREAETPDYLPAQPPSFRALATPRVLARLAKVGVQFWDDPQSAADRLVQLADLVETGAGRASSVLAIRKAYETAWRDLLDIDASPPEEVIVLRQGELLVIDLPSQDLIYVPHEGGMAKERLLSQAPVAVLAVRDPHLAARVQQYLIDHGMVGLQSTADAKVDVTVNGGQSAAEAPSQPLNHYGGSWLQLLILAILEFQHRGLSPIPPAQLADAERSLDELDVVVVSSMTTTIDDHPISYEGHLRSLLIDTADRARVIVPSGEHTSRWTILEAASSALMELVGAPGLDKNLQLALMKLERACGDNNPTSADIAAALNLSDDEIAALIAEHGIWRTGIKGLVAILACLDVDVAEQFRTDAAGFSNSNVIAGWLRSHIPSHSPEMLIRFAARDDLRSALDELGITLEVANKSLRALGLEPLHNIDGHARSLAAYLQQNRAALHNEIRDRFIATFRAGEPLTDYLRIRESMPEPDPAWLDRYWDLPEDVLRERVSVWLDRVCPAGEPAIKPLPPVDELREAGGRTITSVLANARVLVEAWLHRNAAGQGARPGDRTAVTAAMTSEGLLDFGRLTASDLIRWLRAHDQWPTDMKLTTSRAELGFTEQDLEEARSRLEATREQQRRRATYIRYGDRTYSDDPSDLRALVDAVRAAVPASLLATPIEPVQLSVVPMSNDEARQRHRTGGHGSFRSSTPPDEKLKAIGLAGEVVVGEWLRCHFGVPPEDTWVSGNRAEVLADGKGDDRLGYDFEVCTPDRTWLFEVKATTGDSPEFSLSESEVRRAHEVGPDEKYVIVFITNVLSPEKRRIYSLPNPLASGGLKHYHVAGRAMRLQFELPEL